MRGVGTAPPGSRCESVHGAALSCLPALVALLLVPALVACSAAAEPDRGEDASDPTELESFEVRIWGEVEPGKADPRQREAEEAIASCMVGKGFEYEPQVAADQYGYSTPTVLTREHAETYGYGETIPPAPGVPPSRWSAGSVQVAGEQENLDYRASLSAAAVDAYWVALNGDLAVAAGGPAGTVDVGCYGRVMAEVYADAVVPEVFRGAETAVRQWRRTVETEPRVVAAVERWAVCMAEAGHAGLRGRGDAHGLVIDLADSFPAPAGTSFEEITAGYAAELAELQELERTIALTDVDCLERSDFFGAWDAARTEIHARVVMSFRDDLEAWASWAEEKRAARP